MNKDVQELLELAEDAIEYIPEYFLGKYGHRATLNNLRSRLSTVGCWIPCDADNPPPADTPMLVWKIQSFYKSRQASWSSRTFPCHKNYSEAGQPGEDFTFYMLTGEPE